MMHTYARQQGQALAEAALSLLVLALPLTTLQV
jgi:hypothetical protein